MPRLNVLGLHSRSYVSYTCNIRITCMFQMSSLNHSVGFELCDPHPDNHTGCGLYSVGPLFRWNEPCFLSLSGALQQSKASIFRSEPSASVLESLRCSDDQMSDNGKSVRSFEVAVFRQEFPGLKKTKINLTQKRAEWKKSSCIYSIRH